MTSSIDLKAILIANAMGLIILFSIMIENLWQVKAGYKHTRMLIIMFFACLIACIADPLCFIADGNPGLLNYILVFGCNTLIFLGYIIIGFSWLLFLHSHLNIKFSKARIVLYATIFTTAVTCLIVNIFTPVIFRVNEQNVYSRTPTYWLYFLLDVFTMAEGIRLYILTSRKSGGLKFFPVWAFVVPALTGALIQSFCYGVSTTTPFITVSLSCICSSLQNEFLLRDKLTGLYNRFYLDTLESKIKKTTSYKYTVMMLDINKFKSINDIYGHNMGDKALVDMSRLLNSVIRDNGEVIRYAGDEFIIILNTQDDKNIENVITSIQETISRFNKSSANPYELTASIGLCKLNLQSGSLYDFLDKVDKDMYKNKQEFYRLHPEQTRRN